MKKILSVMLVFSVVAAGLISPLAATTAQALTQSDVDAICLIVGCSNTQRTALNALVTSGGSCPVLTQPLTIGSRGTAVTDLQNYLKSTGHFTFSGGATGYFGPITQAAVAAWQAANGVSPTAGYWGPISLAKYNNICKPAPAVTPVTNGDSNNGNDTGNGNSFTLKGGAGSITDADYTSRLNNEEVGEDEEDVEVAGLAIEADKGSDIMLTAITLNFSQGTANRDFRKYADDVSVWLDGDEFARVDADEFDDDDNFDKTISVDQGAIIRAGKTGNLVVAVSGVRNLDSADEGETWTLEFESVRFKDASGAIITDSSTGDINDGSGRTFSFESFATASDTTIRIQLADNNPDSWVINVDNTNDTDNVLLLRFTLEAEGDSDLFIDDFPVTLVVTDASGGVQELNDIVNTLHLELDDEEFSESISSTAASASITFDDIDFRLKAGKTIDGRVLVDLNDIGTSGFEEGDMLRAEISASNRDAIDVEDEAGENLLDGDRKGTAIGNDMALYDVGINVTLVSTSETAQTSDGANNDTGTFTVVFEVEAFDGDVYISTTPIATLTPDNTDISDVDDLIDDLLYMVEVSSTPTTDNLSAIITHKDKVGKSSAGTGGNRVLNDGEKVEFTLTVSRTNDSVGDSGLTRMFLKAVAWNTDDGFGADDYNIYDFNLDDYRTGVVSLN